MTNSRKAQSELVCNKYEQTVVCVLLECFLSTFEGRLGRGSDGLGARWDPRSAPGCWRRRGGWWRFE